MPFFKFGEIAKNDYVCIIFEIWMLMAEYRSKYRGEEVDALLDKVADDNVGDIDSALSLESENPVMNKVITEELNKKVNKTSIATINGQTLTNGGNIEVSTDAYDDTEIKGKLTELSLKVGEFKVKDASVSGNTLNITKSDGTILPFTPQGGASRNLELLRTITLTENVSPLIITEDENSNQLELDCLTVEVIYNDDNANHSTNILVADSPTTNVDYAQLYVGYFTTDRMVAVLRNLYGYLRAEGRYRSASSSNLLSLSVGCLIPFKVIKRVKITAATGLLAGSVIKLYGIRHQ